MEACAQFCQWKEVNAGTLQACGDTLPFGHVAFDSGSTCLCPHLWELARLAKVQPELDFLCQTPSILSLPCDFISVIQGKDTTFATLPVLPSLQTTLFHFLVLLSQVEEGRTRLPLVATSGGRDVSEGLQW